MFKITHWSDFKHMFVCLNIGYQRNSFFKENFWHKKAKVYNENKKSISLKNWNDVNKN